MKKTVALTAVTLLTLASFPAGSHARQDTPDGGPAKSAAQATVSLDVRDARLRDVLEMLFKQAKVNYLIEPGVDGFVTMKVSDQPFEAALKLTLRSGSIPLVYSLENGVYIIRPRPVEAPRLAAAAPPPYPETTLASNAPKFEVIQLVHADPADLAQLLNIIILPTGVRFGNPTPGGSGGLIIGGGFPGQGAGGSAPGNGTRNTPGGGNNGARSGGFPPPGTIIVAP